MNTLVILAAGSENASHGDKALIGIVVFIVLCVIFSGSQNGR